MRPGDVLLFHRPISWAGLRSDPKGTLMCALIQLATRSRYNHAAIAIGDPSASVTTSYAEATAAGVMVSTWGSSSDEVLVVGLDYADEDDRANAVAWATARAGVPYGYLNAVVCGLNNLLVGFGFVIKRTDAIICSELVAEALERAGFDFGKDSALVSPGDLATWIGVHR